MNRSRLILSAYALDLFAGDPEWFPHPVRLMGATIARAEAVLRVPNRSARAELVLGAFLSASVVSGSYIVANIAVTRARERSCLLGNTVEVLLAWTCLAARNLHDEASSVLGALNRADLALARLRLSRIVGRDTRGLSESEISRAVIETVAESLSDGVMAPLFYLALGGVPLAFAYKAINTLDSMIGHADERYFYFGKFAARLDDVANLLPARMTALAITGAASLQPRGNALAAFSTWRADHGGHKSPNAGHPESAMAGALGVRLGGDNSYAGELVHTPFLGAHLRRPSPRQARDALGIAAIATGLGVGLLALLSLAVARGVRR